MNFLFIIEFEFNLNKNILSSLTLFLFIKDYILRFKIKPLIF